MRGQADNYLQTAARYGENGFYGDALTILKLAAESKSQLSGNSMMFYYLGYYSRLSRDSKAAKKYFNQALSLPIEYIFSYGLISAKALESIEKYKSRLLRRSENFFESSSHSAWNWQSVARRKATKDNKVLAHFCKGLFHLTKDETEQARACFNQGLELDPGFSRIHFFSVINDR